MNGYIYTITNIITKRQYIGSTCNLSKRKQLHFRTLATGKHHNVWLQRSYNKYGADAFLFEVVETIVVDTEQELRKIEQIWLDSHKHLYNIGKQATGGDNLSRHPNKDDINNRKRKGRQKWLDSLTSEQSKEIYGHIGETNGMYGRTHSDRVKELSRTNMLEKIKDGRIPIRQGKTNEELFGKEKAEEISRKLSEIGKMRTGEKNPFYGRTHTEEFKQEASERVKKRWNNKSTDEKLKHNNIKPVQTDQGVFISLSEAAKHYGCTAPNILYKIRSDKYPQFKYLSDDEIQQNFPQQIS